MDYTIRISDQGRIEEFIRVSIRDSFEMSISIILDQNIVRFAELSISFQSISVNSALSEISQSASGPRCSPLPLAL